MSAGNLRLIDGAAAAWRRFRRSGVEADGLEEGLSPAVLWMGAAPPRHLLYVTKLAIHRWLVGLLHPADPLLLYGHGGLPSAAVCRHVAATARHFEIPVLFLGDLDPGDLTVLLALQRGGPGLTSGEALAVRHLGVGDLWLRRFRRQVPSASIELSPAERDHLRLLKEIAPGLEALLGPRAMRLLDGGRKIEVEGLLRHARPGTAAARGVRAMLLGRER
jgi:hypothetical protein